MTGHHHAACAGVAVCLVAGVALALAPARAQTPADAPPGHAAASVPVEALSPVEMMEAYRRSCGGEAGRAVSRDGAEAARTHGQRCDALARAIQKIDLDDRRAGSADLARPDFYAPRGE
ncbi:hypothetical protein [Roseospira visakhapatnamensis]|uniref:UrcA family protein n=1 Tax=Roseospira visakhapatnamensis TaxID=390880 RepID=A0A7W6REX8_9PROT|nr:hypothetical protein [Roseospira visakhapatnamensis]MBB4267172.1 hypothetical protein [Roseospira visakhapatnamensis]